MDLSATTDDPALHLRVDGRTVMPSRIDGAVYRFELASASCDIRIVSRAVVPSTLDPAHPDSRRLGVNVRSIALFSAPLDLFVPQDDPALEDGFHRIEDRYRWTNGDAAIPPALLAPFEGALAVEIELGAMELRYPV